MNGPRGSRVVWVVLLMPPVLLLAIAGAVSIWPQPIIDLANRVSRINWSQPEAPRHGQPPSPPAQAAAPPAPAPSIHGFIRKPDGSPYEGRYSLNGVHYQASRKGFQGSPGHGTFQHGSGAKGPTFTQAPQNDFNLFIVDAPDYAPGIIGPIASKELKPDAPPFEVVLQEGFPHRVRVIDAEGAPIARAVVQAGLTIKVSTDRAASPVAELGDGTVAGRLRRAVWTDEDGWAAFSQVRAETDYEFSATVYDGMMPDDTVFVRPKPGVDTVITLPRSSTTGVVVDDEGRPSADAILLIASEFDERNGQESSHAFERVIAAKTDEAGRFRLPSLHQDSSYLIRVEGADDSLGFAGDVRASASGLRIEVRKPRTVRGVVPPEWANSVSVSYTTPAGFSSRRKEMGAHPVRYWWRPFKVAADGRFEFPVWDPSQVDFKIKGQVVSVPWPPPPDPIAFETPAPPQESMERTVRFKVQIEGSDRPDDPVDGPLTLRLTNGSPDRSPQAERRLVEVHKGSGTFTCPRKDAYRYDVDSLPGYWTFPGTFHPSPGDSPMEAIHAIPARPIQGRVFEPDGSPAEPGLNVSLQLKIRQSLRPDEKAAPGGRNLTLQSRDELQVPGAGSATLHAPMGNENLPLLTRFPPSTSTTTDAEGRFTIKAWPIGVPGQIVVSRGRSEQVDAHVQVGLSEAIPEMKIELPKTAIAEVHLLDPDGRPLADQPLYTSRMHDKAWRMWSAGTTDSDGRALIDGLVEGEEGYNLTVKFPKEYQTIVAPLKLGSSLELKAERGQVIEGRVVEAVTGWPIPKVSLAIVSTTDRHAVTQTETDSDGRFRIDTLPAGTYQILHHLMFSGRHSWTIWPTVEAGSGRPVDLRVSNLSQHSPQPRRPARP